MASSGGHALTPILAAPSRELVYGPHATSVQAVDRSNYAGKPTIAIFPSQRPRARPPARLDHPPATYRILQRNDTAPGADSARMLLYPKTPTVPSRIPCVPLTRERRWARPSRARGDGRRAVEVSRGRPGRGCRAPCAEPCVPFRHVLQTMWSGVHSRLVEEDARICQRSGGSGRLVGCQALGRSGAARFFERAGRA